MSRRMGEGPSAVSFEPPCSIPAEKWRRGLDGSLLASDPHFANVQFWRNFVRGSATAASFTNLRIANPDTGETLLKRLSDKGFEVKAEMPGSSSGHAIFFGENDIHPSHDDCQHWAVYERLGPLMNESAHEYVIQFLKKLFFEWIYIVWLTMSHLPAVTTCLMLFTFTLKKHLAISSHWLTIPHLLN